MTAAFNSYLAWNVENFLPYASFVYLLFFCLNLFIQALPPSFNFSDNNRVAGLHNCYPRVIAA